MGQERPKLLMVWGNRIFSLRNSRVRVVLYPTQLLCFNLVDSRF